MAQIGDMSSKWNHASKHVNKGGGEGQNPQKPVNVVYGIPQDQIFHCQTVHMWDMGAHTVNPTALGKMEDIIMITQSFFLKVGKCA